MTPTTPNAEEPQPCLQRLRRAALRHPRCTPALYEQLGARWQAEGRTAAALDALYGRFFVLERLGLALDLRRQLEAGLNEATEAHLPQQAARLHEALGRLHYQMGEYQLASTHWSQALDLAAMLGDGRTGVAARIGLGQIHYALGDWPTGERFHSDARGLLQGLDDDYLESKLRINLGVGLFNRQQYEAAAQEFGLGRAAAARAGHRDYVAEAQWHEARSAQARGQHEQALQLCREALARARQAGYAWLQTMASATLTELAAAGDDIAEAIRCGEESLELARRLGARRQQSTAHRALAKLYQNQGRLQAALNHLWQHQELEGELYRLSLPERLSALARFDLSQQPPEERLLNLSNRMWSIESEEDLAAAVQAMRPEIESVLAVDAVQFWWDAQGRGEFAPLPPVAAAQLDAEHCPRYLAMLDALHQPLALSEWSLHPCHAELSALAGASGLVLPQSRLEFALRLQGRVRAVLWLDQQHALRAWSRDELLRASHIAKLYERLLLALDLAQAKRAQQEMEREKFSSLGRLVASVAHDVNTPVGVAITAASGLGDAAARSLQALRGERVSRQELTALAEQMHASAELVERNLQRAATLIGDFKRISVDQQAETLETFRLADYLRSVVSVHSPVLRKAGIECRLDIPEALEMTQVSGLLTQVFSNLIMNSLTHAFPAGRGGQIEIAAEACGADQLLISYSDDGVGLSPEARRHAFEPFFTTKRGQGGSGLGMYIVYSIVHKLGGSLELPERPRGMCLRMRLPRSAQV